MQMENAEDVVEDVCTDAGFDDVDFAKEVLDSYENKGNVPPGRLAPGVVYAAARIKGKPIRPGEVADAGPEDMTGNDVANKARLISDDLPFSFSVHGQGLRYVERYADDLGLPDDVRRTAFSVCEDAVDAGEANGRSPSAFAAAVVYAAGKVERYDIKQTEVAEQTDVAETMIRRRYEDIMRAAGYGDDPEDYIEDVYDGLDVDVSDRVREEVDDAVGVIDNDDEWVLESNPAAVAAAVVAYMSESLRNFDVSQQAVADAAGVSRHAVGGRLPHVRRSQIDDLRYNELKRVAGENGVDVGMTPERDELVDALVDSGVVV